MSTAEENNQEKQANESMSPHEQEQEQLENETYISDGKRYTVQSHEELLTKIKNKSPFTRDRPLQDYIDNVAAKAINAFSAKHKVPSTGATASQIVAVWLQMKIIEKA